MSAAAQPSLDLLVLSKNLSCDVAKKEIGWSAVNFALEDGSEIEVVQKSSSSEENVFTIVHLDTFAK